MALPEYEVDARTEAVVAQPTFASCGKAKAFAYRDEASKLPTGPTCAGPSVAADGSGGGAGASGGAGDTVDSA